MILMISFFVAIAGALWTTLKVAGPTWKKIAAGIGVAIFLLFLALCMNYGIENVLGFLTLFTVCTFNPHCMS